MSESKQRQTGNKVGGDSAQRSDAEKATQIVESSEIAGSLTQESLRAKKANIEDVLKQVLAAVERLGLQEDDKADLKAQAETAQAQMKAKTPKPAIVTESLKSIWVTLKGAATSAAASGAGLLVKDLMDKIVGFLR
jgi:hypothetical protein